MSAGGALWVLEMTRLRRGWKAAPGNRVWVGGRALPCTAPAPFGTVPAAEWDAGRLVKAALASPHLVVLEDGVGLDIRARRGARVLRDDLFPPSRLVEIPTGGAVGFWRAPWLQWGAWAPPTSPGLLVWWRRTSGALSWDSAAIPAVALRAALLRLDL